eukprot:352358-Chlamydomonas_euryale.AAC.1
MRYLITRCPVRCRATAKPNTRCWKKLSSSDRGLAQHTAKPRGCAAHRCHGACRRPARPRDALHAVVGRKDDSSGGLATHVANVPHSSLLLPHVRGQTPGLGCAPSERLLGCAPGWPCCFKPLTQPHPAFSVLFSLRLHPIVLLDATLNPRLCLASMCSVVVIQHRGEAATSTSHPDRCGLLQRDAQARSGGTMICAEVL